MGNSQSTSTTNNPTWKSYVIQERVELDSGKVKFYLDRGVKYSNGYRNYITCLNDEPYYTINFNIIGVGDRVEVNWYRSEDYSSSHVFTSSDNLRTIRFQQALHHYVQVPDKGNLLRN